MMHSEVDAEVGLTCCIVPETEKNNGKKPKSKNKLV